MRKIPQQSRAKLLVASIIQAAEQGIGQYGIHELTTPKIAEIAGISVGSLYQYFENKDEILAMLVEQKSHALGHQIQQELLQQPYSDFRQLIRQTIEFGFFHIKDGVNQELILYALHLSPSYSIDVMQQYFFELGQQVLGKHYEAIRTDQMMTRLFIIINSTIYSMLRYVQKQPNMISQADLTDQLCEMVSCYLLKCSSD